MSPEMFLKSLRDSRKRLDLTPSDLALWFGRPRATIKTWLEQDRTPRGERVLAECVRRLKLLQLSPAFPVPYEVTALARTKYVRTAYERANNAGVSSGDSTSER